MRATYDRKQACDRASLVFDRFGQLQSMSGGQLRPTLRHEYKSITLSPDGKTATVEYSNKLLIGDRLISRSRSTETLIRRSGKILSRGGRSDNGSDQ